ncbi:MAG TPA: autotransporter-associated beta strand repeat-containing protein [Rariglobus sp.]|nr:autotransporter-associated beta strand repeat-containing protein [Rariglobus sp.]
MSLHLNHVRNSVVVLAAFAVLPSAAPTLFAVAITDYDPIINNRFSSGFLTDPVTNTNAAFVGNGFDFSGVGWVQGTGVPGATRIRNATMLTPMHVMMAKHLPANTGTPYSFVGSDNTLYTATLRTTNVIPPPSGSVVSNDLLVGTLTTPFSDAQQVTPYRILETRGGSLTGQPLFIYGSYSGTPDTAGPRIGTATANSSSIQVHGWTSPGSATGWESGDSGSPAFVKYTAPDGTVSMTFAGAAWFAGNFSTLLGVNTAQNNPGSFINNITRGEGYALKYTIYDRATDTVRTASQWTGATGNALDAAGNWSLGAVPTDQSVLFDAGSTEAISLTVDTPVSLRGALFKASASTNGFTFSGAGSLTLGYTGLRNEATATQTFNIPITLGDSQNWEAVNGNLVFNGAVETTSNSHLLAIGGAANTTLNGVLSGTGGLAKDDSGILTLNAANTYTGKTWIHGGTLRLGTGSILSSSEIIFQTTNPATFDLNGKSQTIAGLKSLYGGTGHVALGGGTLTLNLSAESAFNGDITGSGNIVKTGSALFIASGNNTYTGDTTLTAGTFRAASATALSGNSNIVLNGGILEFTAGDYLGTLGTGGGQLRFTGSGGFSAFGGNRKVTLNNGSSLTWGDASFIASGNQLILSSGTADSTVELTNALALGASGSGTRILAVNNGSAAVDARLSGNLSDGAGTYSFQKSNAGTLELTGTNTYKGETIIAGGALRLGSAGALSASSNVVLSGGVLELGTGDYTAALGTGAGQVRFAGNGGFSASGANRAINLGGSATPASLTWGDAHFVAAGNSLILSSSGSDATVDFRNSIVLGTSGTGTRTVQVDNGSASIDARLSGALTDTGTGVYSFTKTGAGTLELTGTNSWRGSTTVGGGVLRLAPSVTLPTGNIVLSNGGVIELAGANFVRTLGTGTGQVSIGAGGGGFSAARSDRIVYLDGGAPLAWGGANFMPSTGSLVFSSDSADATVIFMNGLLLGTTGSGDRSILVNNGAAAVDARITGDITSTGGSFALSKNGAGTLELTGNNTYSSATWLNAGVLRIGSTTALSSNANIVMNGGILELGAADLAANLGTGAGQVQLRTGFAFSASGATRNLTLNGGSAFRWGVDYDGSRSLVFSSAGSDATINFTNAISLTNTGPTNRVVEVNNGSAAVDARLSGVISQGGEVHGLTKTGAGTLELTAANTYLGSTLVAAGILHINGNQSGATGAVVVSSGATLGGIGRIGGATFITSGGTLALGASPRLLTFESTLTFDADSIFIVTLNKGSTAAIAGTDYDKIVVGSTATLNGAQLSLNLTSSFVATAQQGTVFTILTSDGLIGNTDEGASTSITLNGTRYDFGIGYAGNLLTLTLQNISAVPEPATTAMLAAFGAGCLALLRRRRRAKAPCRPEAGTDRCRLLCEVVTGTTMPSRPPQSPRRVRYMMETDSYAESPAALPRPPRV